MAPRVPDALRGLARLFGSCVNFYKVALACVNYDKGGGVAGQDGDLDASVVHFVFFRCAGLIPRSPSEHTANTLASAALGMRKGTPWP
jgi:hypothetical protein